MKLSEAIRLGAMLRPQSFTNGFDGTGTCAWGAAFEAVGYAPKGFKFDGAWMPKWGEHEFHKLFDKSRACPDCGARFTSDMIVHLNDDHRLTREPIADWVE